MLVFVHQIRSELNINSVRLAHVKEVFGFVLITTQEINLTSKERHGSSYFCNFVSNLFYRLLRLCLHIR
jgi:hypothetical protein